MSKFNNHHHHHHEETNKPPVKQGLVFYDNIGTQIDTQQVVSSNEAYYYIPTKKPIVPPLPTPFDNSLKIQRETNQMVSHFPEVDNKFANKYNTGFIRTLIDRFNFAMLQNSYSVFLDGLNKVFKPIYKDENKALEAIRYRFFDNYSYYIINYYNYDLMDNISVDNAMQFAIFIRNEITAGISRLYSDIINELISDDRIDLIKFADIYLKDDPDINPDKLNEAAKTTFAMSAINETANNDIGKIYEIAEINAMELVSQIINNQIEIKDDKPETEYKYIPQAQRPKLETKDRPIVFATFDPNKEKVEGMEFGEF